MIRTQPEKNLNTIGNFDFTYADIYIFAFYKIKAMAIQFKQLEIKPEGNWIKRNILSSHGKKTMIYMIIGAALALIITFFTEEKSISAFSAGEIFQSIFVGAAFGLFITNSPCARGRC